jgi:hypothetical protein
MSGAAYRGRVSREDRFGPFPTASQVKILRGQYKIAGELKFGNAA